MEDKDLEKNISTKGLYIGKFYNVIQGRECVSLEPQKVPYGLVRVTPWYSISYVEDVLYGEHYYSVENKFKKPGDIVVGDFIPIKFRSKYISKKDIKNIEIWCNLTYGDTIIKESSLKINLNQTNKKR